MSCASAALSARRRCRVGPGAATDDHSSAGARLTISRIETVPICVLLEHAYSGSHYRMTHRSTVITRVHTDEGIFGEAYAGDEHAPLEEMVRIVHHQIEPTLIGEDAFAIERCWEFARPATHDILRDRRLGLVACAGVDTALRDAVGKRLGQPLWRLWGGNRLQMISIGGHYGDDIGAEVAELRERGLAGLKFKVGARSPEEDAARFRSAREAAGPGLRARSGREPGWRPADAIRFARLVEDCDLAWFEEPCRWANDRRAMRDVRFGAGVRVCAGQSEYSAAGRRDLMVEASIDVCNFDASWSGGPTEWRRAAAIALAYDVAMGHHEEPQVASHLLASFPQGLYAECFHPNRDPIWWNLVANRPPLRDGWFELPDRPGLGWELDLDYVENHRVST